MDVEEFAQVDRQARLAAPIEESVGGARPLPLNAVPKPFAATTA